MFDILYTDDMTKPSMEMSPREVRDLLYTDGSEVEVAIIVLSYNNLEKTRRCITSILDFTKEINYQLVLINHGSEDGTQEYFESIQYENKSIIQVTKNISGVFCTNYTLTKLNAQYYVIVPNDLVVTPNWLTNLLICAKSDSKIGMINPVSTNVSNCQFENMGGFSSYEEMVEKAKKFNVSNPSLWEERMRLIPLGVLVSREALENTGVFDIGFIHDFGDDDISFRIRRAGYKLIVARDTFVHHDHTWGERNTTFEQERTRLGRKNFVEKYHGIDAWEDINNFIFPYYNWGNLFADWNKEPKRVLGIDVKCGTPITDVKNGLRKQGIYDVQCDACTMDEKYYTDLISIADHVVVDDFVHQYKLGKTNSYHVIVCGTDINKNRSYLEYMEKIYQALVPGGIALLPVYNEKNHLELCHQLGIVDHFEVSGVVEGAAELLTMAKMQGFSDVKVTAENFDIGDNGRTIIERVIATIISDEAKKEEFMNMGSVIRYYVALIK